MTAARSVRAARGAAPRIYQRAFDILAGQIAEGAIAAGARLQESAIAAQFNISRAPARQALAELERHGLVTKAAGRGYVVSASAKKRSLPPAPAQELPEDDLRRNAPSSWQRIYGEVEGEIAARISFASWRVNEAELARHYNVSRTVARDVVGRLQQRGVVRKDDRSRWHAPALTPDHVGELYELRWLLEPVALLKAAPNLPGGLLGRFRVDLERAMASAARIGGETLDELEQQLHVELLGHCRNRTLMQAITLPQSLLIAHHFLYRWTSRLYEAEPFLPEHLDIILCLEGGRATEAAVLLERHLRVSRERAIGRVEVIVRSFRPDDLPYLERLDAA